MSASLFPLLASPVRLGPVELRNRIVLLPHGLFVADRDELVPTPRHTEYYRARARGGVGMVFAESAVVSADGAQIAPLVMASDPRCVEGYAAIVEAVHAEGAAFGGQLTHYGNQAASGLTRAPLLGPSSLPDPAVREPARPVGRRDMDRIREDFCAGARHMAAAGVDAVELKVAHDGLLRQFLSPLTNDRTDEYGGSRENRIRYVLEVAAAVRAEIGRDVALGVRLVVDECVPGGYDLEDGVAFAQAIEASGLVDYISADVGIWASVHMVTAPMAIAEGYAEDAFARVSAECGLPVIAFGRIRRPEHGERILAEGKAAAIGMARELLADPDFAVKALGGEPERIRPCTACNQLCVGNAMKGLAVSCTVNPLASFGERRAPDGDGPARRVVVAGGGPAGMEAARVAAEAGHAVTLHERTDALGGRLALAAATGGRGGWAPYVAWLEGELARLGVEVRLGSEAGAAELADADVAVVAVGSGASAPPWDGAVDLDDFARGDAIAPRVALVDCGAAGPPLWFAAIEASVRGAEAVTIVTPVPMVGGDLDGATLVALLGDLHRRGIVLRTDHVVTGVEGTRLALVNVHGGAPAAVEADLVVASSPRRAAGEALAGALGGGPRVLVVGDALSPRDAAAAIREGQEAGAAAQTLR